MHNGTIKPLFDPILNFHPTQLCSFQSLINKHEFSLGIKLQLEQEDSITAKNHLSKQRKEEHQNGAGRKERALRILKRAAHPDAPALISRAPLQGIIFNQLLVSTPRM